MPKASESLVSTSVEIFTDKALSKENDESLKSVRKKMNTQQNNEHENEKHQDHKCIAKQRYVV